MTAVGFLGVRHVHAEDYVRALRALGTEPVGVWDADPEVAAAWAARTGVPVVPREELVERCDGVVVTSTTREHRDLVEGAAGRVRAVLVDKPLATDEHDAQSLVTACARTGTVLQTALPLRYQHDADAVRRALASGELGTVRHLRGINQSVDPSRHAPWFADPHEAGGGAVMDHVVHLADLYSWWLGEQPADVAAVTSAGLAPHLPVDSVCLVTLRYPSGVVASIDASWSRPDHDPVFGTCAVTITTSTGVVDLDLMTARVEQTGRRAPDVRWHLVGDDPVVAMLDDFLSSARTGSTPRATGADGLAATRTALRARGAARLRAGS